MTDRPDIPALIGSRICHDLISPLGAIGNGIELMAMSGLPQTPEFALISQSVENANAKIRFFRVAFGSVAPDQFIAQSEVVSILGAIARGGRYSYHWDAVNDQPRAEVRAVFLLLLCLEAAMPRGGDMHIEQAGDDWALIAHAPTITLLPPLWEPLQNGAMPDDVSASQVQFAMLPDALAGLGRRLRISVSGEKLEARF